jgi:hypothetical protein
MSLLDLQTGDKSSAIRLIALTGYGQAGDLEKNKQSGFDLHLVKPVDIEALLKAMEQVLPDYVERLCKLSAPTSGSFNGCPKPLNHPVHLGDVDRCREAVREGLAREQHP